LNRGNWEEAERLYRQSLEVKTELGDRAGMATSWGVLGDIQRNRGNWHEAERLYRQSLELRAELGDRQGIATSWGQLGDIQRFRGNWDEAERLYQQSLALFTELGDRLMMAISWGQLGDIQRNRGNWNEAERLYQQSLALRTELGDRAGMAESWASLGDIQRLRGNWEEAERLYQQSLALRTELGDRKGMADVYNVLALVYQHFNRIPEAIAAWKEGLTICPPERFPLEALELGRNLGDAAFEIEDWETAIYGYEAAIEAVETRCTFTDSYSEKQKRREAALDLYPQLVQACINGGDIGKALASVERSKSRNLIELLFSANRSYPKNATVEQKQRISALRRQIAIYQQQLAYTPRDTLISTTENNPNQPSPETLIRKPLEVANLQFQHLLTELDDPNFTLTQQVLPELPDLSRLLPPQTALIEWYLPSEADSGFYAFLVSRRRDEQIQITPHHFSAEDRQHLDQALQDYRSDYRQSSWNEQLTQRLETLSAALQLPHLLAELSQIKQLILIPHRELHIIPLHALPVSFSPLSRFDAEGKDVFLQDIFPKGVSYALNCQLLALAQNRSSRPHFNRLFAIQNPTEDLQFTNLEVEAIQSLFNSHQVLKQNQAQKAAINAEILKNAHCTHF
ncbi:CHAT domain-containing protein, partial [Limnospira indica]|uniref:CHAT domain-containing protein n=1 Tax=Limnospira indica TaxID=147322 RepID=UPI002357D6FB